MIINTRTIKDDPNQQPSIPTRRGHTILWIALGIWLMTTVIVSSIAYQNRTTQPAWRRTEAQSTPTRIPTAQPTAAPIVLLPAVTPMPVATPVVSNDRENNYFSHYDKERAGEVRTYAVVERVIKLEIKSEAGQDHLVRLYSAHSNRLVMSVYIQGGKNQTVGVPIGDFIIKVASGIHWHGYNGLFGSDTTYMKMDTVFNYKQGYTYWITLYTTPNGNLRTAPILKDEF